MSTLMWLVFAGLLLGLTPGSAAAQTGTSDPRAVEIVERMHQALGGLDAYDAVRHIRFTFVRGEASPLRLTWDKFTGRYRLDATTDDGRPQVVLMNVETREGRAFVDGRPLEGQELAAALERALRIWAGEIYWLLAPYKLKDEGAVLDYDGEEAIDGRTYDRIHVTFAGVGLTPGDQFWHWIDRDTRLLAKWRFALQGGAKGEFWWRGWEQHGPLLIATIRESVDGKVTIRMEDVLVADELPDSVFESPAPPAGR